ncbi:hypothetical protein J6590_053811, partial [Homalodisca vitripennis]
MRKVGDGSRILSRLMRKDFEHQTCLLGRREPISVPASAVKAGRGWHALIPWLPTAHNSYGAPPTPAVISCSKLDLSVYSYTPISRHLGVSMELTVLVAVTVSGQELDVQLTGGVKGAGMETEGVT